MATAILQLHEVPVSGRSGKITNSSDGSSGAATVVVVIGSAMMITVATAVVVVTRGSVVLVVDVLDVLDELDVVVEFGAASAVAFIETSRCPDPQLVELEHSKPTIRMW
jgi:hypothetical protein